MTAYLGMSAGTGRALSDGEHLRQSIIDIVFTRIGTRVERRDYGSLLPDLIDAPTNPATLQKLKAAIVMALIRWEPRLKVSRITITLGDAPGQAWVQLVGTLTETGAAIDLAFPLVQPASYPPNNCLLVSTLGNDWVLIDASHWLRVAA